MPEELQQPVIAFISPNKGDRELIEIWDSDPAAYQPLDLGTAHPSTREFPGFKLGAQRPIPNSPHYVQRIWVKDEGDPTWWNWSQQFDSDANAYPIFIREFRELRNTYAPSTKGQPLKRVYKLTKTGAGSGYTPGDLPPLTFDNSGTGGTGAAGHAVVNPDGTIGEFVLDNGGSGYDAAPTFTAAAPPSGTTATGTATIQPTTAVLVAEKADSYPPDSEFFGLYLKVTRVYKTLPGFPLVVNEIGAPDVVPARYKSQTTRVETKTPVKLPYSFPTALSGTQILVRLTAQSYIEGELLVIEQNVALDVAPLITQEYDDKLGISKPGQELLTNDPSSFVGVPGVGIEPLSHALSIMRKQDTSQLNAVLRSIVLPLGNMVQLDFPDILDSVTIYYEYAKGAGAYDEASPSASKNLSGVAMGNAEGSLSLMPHIVPSIREAKRWAPVIELGLFLPIPFDSYDVAGAATVLYRTLVLLQTGTAVTVTIASPGVITWAAHGFSNGDPVAFSTSAALPTGLVANRLYYIANKTPNTFQLAATRANAVAGTPVINTSGSQSGTHKGFAGIDDLTQFDAAPVQVIAVGGRLTMRAETKTRLNFTDPDNNSSVGKGYSVGVGSLQVEAHIAATIHGQINVTIDPDKNIPLDTLKVISHSKVGQVLALNPAPPEATVSLEDSVGISVNPAVIPATTVTSIPTTGLKVYRYFAEIYTTSVDGSTPPVVTRFAMVHVVVVDMSKILPPASGAGIGTFGTPKSTVSTATAGAGSVALAGYVNPNGLSTTILWQYGTDPSFGLTSSESTSPISSTLNTNHAVSKTISSLTAGTQYYFRLKCVNAQGTTFSAAITATPS